MLFWLLLVLILAAALWGFVFEPKRLQIRRLEVGLENWSGEPFTALFLTDLHIGSSHVGLSAADRLIARANELKPDLILLGGDFLGRSLLDWRIPEAERVADTLAGLRAEAGVYAVLGNWDWENGGRPFYDALDARGITILENASTEIRIRGQSLYLVGLADERTRVPSAARAFRDVPAMAAKLLLMHDPASFMDVPDVGAFAMAGDTHGGQIRLPWFGALWTPSESPRDWAYGTVKHNNQLMYVSSGIGTSLLPIRLFAPPEMVLFRFRAAELAETGTPLPEPEPQPPPETSP